MVNNKKGRAKPKNYAKIDWQSEQNEILEKLKSVVVAETEEITNSYEKKFDEIAAKLQSMEESISKNSILSNSSKNWEQKSAKRFVLKHVFENVNDLDENNRYAYSEEEEHFDMKWKMKIERNKNHIGLFVFCNPIAPVENKYSIETKFELRMMGRDNNNATKTLKYCFETKKGYGCDRFLKWQQLEDDYLIDDKLTAQVEVEIMKMSGYGKKRIRKFDESQKEVSDVVVVVQDAKFYVLKMYLAAQSPFFKTLFLGNFSESGKSELTLSGIDSNDFQRFLEVLYGESAIDDSTIEGILLVADMYDTSIVVRKCEEFLMEKSKKNLKKKLLLSTQYCLEKLKTQCLSVIHNIYDVRVFLPGDLSDLDPSDVLAILQKCVSHAGVSDEQW
ncbi:hypothetical protein L5515_015668 [Caenorhabditis briggsae]|uniref:BTB domain-containing protein n=2 Tax=Caenorhabditis briggsae TaxID=6238 RepID=A0AAE9EER9_CAEBR|nr:hypothetical protein L5515_015668 [Caenorhabditis briggsae]